MLRGVPWRFFPTTLLAQSDSCIGSKSSINLGQYKNLLGTFLPPEKIHIASIFRNTLDHPALCSGIGEMIKVHAIAGRDRLDHLNTSYAQLFTNPNCMSQFIHDSLEIKRTFIEEDEYDQGIRNVLNYGHSFGHAIESATEFAIPHGIAVTIGMDMANFVAAKLNLIDIGYFERYRKLMAANTKLFHEIQIPIAGFMDAIMKDKKNIDAGLVLILPVRSCRIKKTLVSDLVSFKEACNRYLHDIRNQKTGV